MKKSVILSIIFIYIASIVAVGFLGGAIQSYYQTVYVENIICKSEEFTPYPEYKQKETGCVGEISAKISQIDDLIITLIFEVQPANANNKELSYTYNTNKWECIESSSNSITLKYIGPSTGDLSELIVSPLDIPTKKFKIRLFVTSEKNPFGD